MIDYSLNYSWTPRLYFTMFFSHLFSVNLRPPFHCGWTPVLYYP